MPIERNAHAGGNYISVAGEYVVKITETTTGLSKKEKPMLTVTFQNKNDESIRAFFVRGLAFHIMSLCELKRACGLKEAETADNLVGKECGILVEARKPDEMGNCFMHIVGYGPANAVGTGHSNKSFSDEVPF